MKTVLAEANFARPNGGRRPVAVEGVLRRFHTVGLARVFVLAAAVLCITAVPMLGQQAQTSSIPKAKCVIGCENIKANANGTLSVLPSGLQFATEKQSRYAVRPRGNSVTHEDEMMKVASNQMDFEAVADLYTRSLSLIKLAIGKA